MSGAHGAGVGPAQLSFMPKGVTSHGRASWGLALELAVAAYWRNRPDPRLAVVALVVEEVAPDGGLVEA